MNIRIIFFIAIMGVANSYPAMAADNLKSKRNPFEFGHKSYPKKNRLELILISKNRKSAIIGGKAYRIGDTVGKYKVKSIMLDHLILANKSESRRITVNETID